jgi:hypothetical protein
MDLTRNKTTRWSPFTHYVIKDVFCEKELSEIRKLDLELHSGKLNGERASNQNRFFITKSNINDNFVFERIIDYFSRDSVIEMFEKESGRTIRGNYLRVEFLEDKESSWLEPHCDIEEKLVSLIIYLNDTNEDEKNGTVLYNEDMMKVRTIPFIDNSGFYFFAGKNTWHGLEPVDVKQSRKAIMVNYCTFETEFSL